MPFNLGGPELVFVLVIVLIVLERGSSRTFSVSLARA